MALFLLKHPIQLRRYKALRPTCPKYTKDTQKTLKEKKIDIVLHKNPLDFNDTKSVFQSVSLINLFRALFIFKTCQLEFVVRNARKIVKTSYLILGNSCTNYLLKKTFFGQFCGGINSIEVQKKISFLQKNKIGVILDYAAEADVEHVVSGGVNVPKDKLTVRVYPYQDEAHCDENEKIVKKAIQCAASQSVSFFILVICKTVKEGQKFAAVKISALTKPELLEHVSSVLNETYQLFYSMTTSNSTCIENRLEQTISYDRFYEILSQSGIDISKKNIEKKVHKINSSPTDEIDFIEWISHIDLLTLSSGRLFHFRRRPVLSEEYIQRMRNMNGRIERISKYAAENGVSLMIDAEQSYLQPAINHLAINLQRKYNKRRSVIFTTIQCYLKNSEENCMFQLKICKKEGWKFACKLVRGAYMIQEKARSIELGYNYPIYPTIKQTHENFNKISLLLLHNVEKKNCSFMAATHNEYSTKLIAEEMRRLRISRIKGVYFAQLLGMCDHLTYNLGKNGFSSYKYVPYGPVHEVLPYLIRRTEENSLLIKESSNNEMLIIKKEIKRRLMEKLNVLRK